jgi:hypothetical protein
MFSPRKPLADAGLGAISLFAILVAIVLGTLAPSAAADSSWSYTVNVPGLGPDDIATFTGTCSTPNPNGAFRCEGTQTAGPAFTTRWDNVSGNCRVSIKPGTPAVARMVCTP